MKHIDIYTDGACKGNPGPGGWGAVLRYNGHEKELSGGEANTTNNRMEMLAVIKALEALKEPCEVTLTTDSRYVCDAVNKGWAKKWKANNWIKSDKSKAKNPELWDKILNLLAVHKVSFVWVKGHNGHPENERCDALASAQAQKYS
ncbi:MAG: ribonuclease HI [Clostridia bacterium]|nr:ribonuclease HI [Clostridia bacterium]